MYQVSIKKTQIVQEFHSLSEAISYAMTVPEFVVISDGTTEIVGHFGADGIIDSKLPNGLTYAWKKRRI